MGDPERAEQRDLGSGGRRGRSQSEQVDASGPAELLTFCSNTQIEAIRGVLKEGQKLRDICIGTPIRQDRAIDVGKQFQASGLPIEGDVTVMDNIAVLVLLQYGEAGIWYWIDG